MDINIMLTEYSKAQDSAEHYNTMCWTLIPILLGFSILIIYNFFTIDYSKINKEIVGIFKEFLLAGGLISLVYFSSLIERSNKIKKIKYDVCKKIEKEHPEHFVGQNKLTEQISKVSYMWLLRAAILILFIVYWYLMAISAYSTPMLYTALIVPPLFALSYVLEILIFI